MHWGFSPLRPWTRSALSFRPPGLEVESPLFFSHAPNPAQPPLGTFGYTQFKAVNP